MHTFHIPVMGTGFSADTPIRVAHFGISSVISIIDDLLLEKIRHYYCRRNDLPYRRISSADDDARARRITAYLDLVNEIVSGNFERLRRQPFFEDNDKQKYFELLPETSPLKKVWLRLLKMHEGPDQKALENELSQRMAPGSIDVNIMVKLDLPGTDSHGNPLGDEFSDAKSALRGYANSGLRSGIVFSAGINQTLFRYMSRFKDFYRDASGGIKKKIIIKVSDYRSALIQGRFLGKIGLEVSEFRIESGLNCGGHAFPANGNLLPCLLQEFKENRDQLAKEFHPLILRYYQKQGWAFPEAALNDRPLITVQGGIGTSGENLRLLQDFGMDRTGWASPFLLVPEATCVDAATREQLIRSGPQDLYLSNASPLGVPFNNLHNSGSDRWNRKKAREGRPGSACPRGLLAFDTEFTRTPICTASSRYQEMKLRQIDEMQLSAQEKERLRQEVEAKECLCQNLGNAALIELGMACEESAPQAICPGQNIAWFNRSYSLRQMVDHIYGRGPSLVSPDRPHMFAQEIIMNVDYLANLVDRCSDSPKAYKSLLAFKNNLESGMDLCLIIAHCRPYEAENLASIGPVVEQQKARLQAIFDEFEIQRLLRVPEPPDAEATAAVDNDAAGAGQSDCKKLSAVN